MELVFLSHLQESISCISTMATRTVQMVQPINRRKQQSKITSFLKLSSINLVISIDLLVSSFLIPPFLPFSVSLFSGCPLYVSRMGSMLWPFLNSLVSVLEQTLCSSLKGCLNSPSTKVQRVSNQFILSDVGILGHNYMCSLREHIKRPKCTYLVHTYSVVSDPLQTHEWQPTRLPPGKQGPNNYCQAESRTLKEWSSHRCV